MKKNIQVETTVAIDSESIDMLADKIVERLMPVLFVCARVSSRDTIRTPYKDVRAIFKDVVGEAKVAHEFYADSVCAGIKR